MRFLLWGSTGGIGSAIKDALEGNEHGAEGKIDWLIFAQGVMKEGDIELTFDVNTKFCISETERCLPNIRKGVIYISSTSAMTANSLFPIYSASKAALNTYSRAMAKRFPQIEFYALCPGPTDTKMWRALKLEGNPQPTSEVAKVVLRIIGGEFKSGDIITVRNGIVTV